LNFGPTHFLGNKHNILSELNGVVLVKTISWTPNECQNEKESS